MEADMQNLYPAWQDASVARRNTAYGMVDGESWRFDNCDFERSLKVIEPRPLARGNIARSIFYMHTQYGLPIKKSLVDELKRWNKEDLPSKQEKSRNDRIEDIQGIRNPYIDDPSLIDSI
jgi:deoxyribonuclease-1|tara:strand:- start:238 stop:597 length:360 start_codon:yes stop_codon:yes gene_type:complete